MSSGESGTYFNQCNRSKALWFQRLNHESLFNFHFVHYSTYTHKQPGWPVVAKLVCWREPGTASETTQRNMPIQPLGDTLFWFYLLAEWLHDRPNTKITFPSSPQIPNSYRLWDRIIMSVVILNCIVLEWFVMWQWFIRVKLFKILPSHCTFCAALFWFYSFS
jgi:hypothetical protein